MKNKLKFLSYWPTGWKNQERSNWQGSALYCLFTHLVFKTFNTDLRVLQCVAKYVCCYLHTFLYKSCWKNPLTQHVEIGKIIWKKHYAYKLFVDLNENDIISIYQFIPRCCLNYYIDKLNGSCVGKFIICQGYKIDTFYFKETRTLLLINRDL